MAVLERIVESRLEVVGASFLFMDGQTRSNPHAIEDGQQARNNNSQAKKAPEAGPAFFRVVFCQSRS